MGLPHIQTGQIGDLIIKFEVEKCGYLSRSEIEQIKTIFEIDDNENIENNNEKHDALTIEELQNSRGNGGRGGNNDDDDDDGEQGGGFPPDMNMNGENVQCAQS
jgi:DnaJ-class molecular chaperone